MSNSNNSIFIITNSRRVTCGFKRIDKPKFYFISDLEYKRN